MGKNNKTTIQIKEGFTKSFQKGEVYVELEVENVKDKDPKLYLVLKNGYSSGMFIRGKESITNLRQLLELVEHEIQE